MKVLICGDRNWQDRELIHSWVDKLAYQGYNTIIEGEARGADQISRELGEELWFTVLRFPADWDKYGRAAGPIRNRQMLDEKPDLVLAFHNNIQTSKGTADTVREAKRRGIRCIIVTHNEEVSSGHQH